MSVAWIFGRLNRCPGGTVRWSATGDTRASNDSRTVASRPTVRPGQDSTSNFSVARPRQIRAGVHRQLATYLVPLRPTRGRVSQEGHLMTHHPEPSITVFVVHPDGSHEEKALHYGTSECVAR